MTPSTSATLYAEARARITAAVRDLDRRTLDQHVPACPEWSVHNLVSHLAGGAADFVNGNLTGAPRPPWTAVQVDARRDRPIGDVLDEWAVTGPQLEQLILSGTTSHPMICNPYVDTGTHEADLHGVLGSGRPPRDIWLGSLAWVLDDSGPLTVTTPDGQFHISGDGPAATAETTTYELFRALFGRRTPAQITSWRWSAPDHAAIWSEDLPRLPHPVSPLLD